jgi:hypothetical protein
MHDPVEVHPDQAQPVEIAEISEVQTAGLSVEPDPVNPVSFTLLSGLVGMAAGMILAPWLERWFKRFGRDKEGNLDE